MQHLVANMNSRTKPQNKHGMTIAFKRETDFPFRVLISIFIYVYLCSIPDIELYIWIAVELSFRGAILGIYHPNNKPYIAVKKIYHAFRADGAALTHISFQN